MRLEAGITRPPNLQRVVQQSACAPLFCFRMCLVKPLMKETRLLLDPWPAEYESPFQIDELDEDGQPNVDITVEGGAWPAMEPRAQVRPEPIHFVDGVRRVEARIIVDDNSGRIIRGLFGSAAVGAVRVAHHQARFEQIRVMRYLVTGSGVSLETEALRVGNTELIFEPYSVTDSGPPAPLFGLQYRMRIEETAVAESLSSESACVFADGPLAFFTTFNRSTVGIIKRLFKSYLPPRSFTLVAQLRVGQRTPVFAITDSNYDRYSWYLRVGTPRVMDHEVAGVLRLEVRGGVGVARAVELADLSAGCIPTFASNSFRDPRSPQNLLPVGSLEQELRHRLGDALAIRRAIELKLFKMSSQ